jgi:hypothetical protein
VKATRYSLVLAIGLACAGFARADLGRPAVPFAVTLAQPLSLPSTSCTATTSQCQPSPSAAPVVDGSVCDRVSGSLLGSEPWDALTRFPAASDEPRQQVRELPGLPGSASLFLSAMLSIGALHVARKSGQLHLGHLPEWYHPDAPYQIGHSVAFDPTLGFELLAVCLFDVPLAAGPARSPDILRELPSRYESQQIPLLASPRGPPSL